ncbi:hypothetical protein [Metabacillus sp. 22489]|uniref:hypothetical protein n=1 Tax=Metabacillus sp. 22489 TaxID=3453928 RepID=UPI003F876847
MDTIFKIIIDLLPLATFLIAVLTFIITFTNFYRNRAKIGILQIDNSTSCIIKPDFTDYDTPDVYWHEDYRAILDVVISNRSALPISIIEYKLNDGLIFNSYSKFGSNYKITTQPKIEKDSKGVIFAMGKELSKIFYIEDSYLKPVTDIPPYTSVRGFIFFHYHDKNKVKIGINKLQVVTSRKTFSFQVKISEYVESALQLPSSIQKARNENFQ